jgi:hypothetical protein
VRALAHGDHRKVSEGPIYEPSPGASYRIAGGPFVAISTGLSEPRNVAIGAVTSSVVVLLVLAWGCVAELSLGNTARGQSVAARDGTINEWIPVNQAAKPSYYSISFKERGLNLNEGHTWNVSINHTKKSSSSPVITFHERPGTYRFVVGNERPYYVARPSTGTVALGSDNATVRIKFAFPISDAFTVDNPSTGTCSTSNVTAHVCDTAGDFTYTLLIPSSTVHFGEIRFEVVTATVNVFSNTGIAGFAVLNQSGGVSAYSQCSAGTGLTMSESWQHYTVGTSNSTRLTNLFTIVIDTGQASPTTGDNLAFVAHGTGAFFGSTSPFSLP